MSKSEESIENTNNDIKLPIFGTLKGVVNGLIEKRKKLATYIVSPIILLILFPFFISYIANNNFSGLDNLDKNISIQFMFMLIFYWFFYCYLYINIAVVTHRVFLDDTSSLRIYHGIIWNVRHIRFLLKLIIFFIAAIALYFLATILMSFAIPFIKQSIENQNSDNFIVLCFLLIFWIPVQYLLARWSLILPAAAIGKKLTTGDSYKITDGNGFRIFILIMFIPTLIVSLLDSPTLTEHASIFLSNIPGYEIWSTIIIEIFIVVFFIFEISLLSMCYGFLSNQKESLIKS